MEAQECKKVTKHPAGSVHVRLGYRRLRQRRRLRPVAATASAGTPRAQRAFAATRRVQAVAQSCARRRAHRCGEQSFLAARVLTARELVRRFSRRFRFNPSSAAALRHTLSGASAAPVPASSSRAEPRARPQQGATPASRRPGKPSRARSHGEQRRTVTAVGPEPSAGRPRPVAAGGRGAAAEHQGRGGRAPSSRRRARHAHGGGQQDRQEVHGASGGRRRRSSAAPRRPLRVRALARAAARCMRTAPPLAAAAELADTPVRATPL